jgi:peptidoglycan/LPS O-acetylase OafA/YrhL
MPALAHSTRISALDSLRGIAATAVVFAHVHGVLFEHHIFLDLTPLNIIWNGGAAVVLFFVLSGFVLSAPFLRGARFHVLRFVAARVARIYLPYVVAIAACVGLALTLFDPAIAKDYLFLSQRWHLPIDRHVLLGHILMLGEFDTSSYDEVIWSLIHEMRFAIVFPIFLWMLRAYTWKTCLVFAGAASVGAAVASTVGIDPSISYKNSYLCSIHYLLFFFIGGIIAKHYSEIRNWASKLEIRPRWLILGTAFIIATYSEVMAYSLPERMHWEALGKLGVFISDWGFGVSAAAFIVMAIGNRSIAGLLETPLLLFLGRISYSLYLVHVPILATALYLLHRQGKLIAVVVALAAVFAGAYLFNSFIEVPCQRLGRQLFGRCQMPAVSQISGKLAVAQGKQ